MSRIALIGGGDFAKEVAEIAELCGHKVVGYAATAAGVLEAPYWGTVDSLVSKRELFDAAVLGFGFVNRQSAVVRAKMITWLEQQGLPTLALVSPHAVRSKGVHVAPGAIVAHAAVLSVDSRIGPFAIINSAAIVGHDAILGPNVTVAPGAFLGGSVSVGEDTLIGPGALVLQGLKVGSQVVVGVGATVPRDVPSGATVMPQASRVIGVKKLKRSTP